MITWYQDEQHVLSLDFTGYQFPETLEEYDANWLFFDLEVTTPELHWKAHCPGFLTRDVVEFARWLEQILAGEPLLDPEFSPLDEDINFECIYREEAFCDFR